MVIVGGTEFKLLRRLLNAVLFASVCHRSRIVPITVGTLLRAPRWVELGRTKGVDDCAKKLRDQTSAQNPQSKHGGLRSS